MAKGQIRHKGRVVSVNPQYTTVEIVSESACSSCHAAGLCGMSEVQKKAVRVPANPYETFEPGQEVNVVLHQSMGLKAVWLCYCIPLLVLLVLMLSLSQFFASELVCGLISLLGVGLYYFGIWLMRDRLSNEYIFKIENLN